MDRVLRGIGSVGYGAIRAARNLALVLGLTAAPAMGDDVTVAALGDSLTQGYGLAPEAGFVPQLQDWLEARGIDATLINAGVSGDTTAGGLSRIDWTLTEEVDALIVALGGNDVLRGLPPEAARANLDGILKVATDRDLPVLLVGITAPGNYGPDYKAAFEAVYPELAGQYGALLYPDFLAPITADPGRALAEWMQSDGIHPNPEGVRRIVEAMGPSVADLIAAAR